MIAGEWYVIYRCSKCDHRLYNSDMYGTHQTVCPYCGDGDGGGVFPPRKKITIRAWYSNKFTRFFGWLPFIDLTIRYEEKP